MFPPVAAGERSESNLRCTIPQIFREDKVPIGYERETLSVMRSLAHDSSQVPPRYQVDPHSLTVEGAVFASGAFAEVRKGRLDGRMVAIRTLRIDRQTDPQDALKVRVSPN